MSKEKSKTLDHPEAAKEPRTETKSREAKTAKSDTQAFVNAWGFIHLSKEAMGAFGVQKGRKTPITINIEGDALVIRKT